VALAILLPHLQVKETTVVLVMVVVLILDQVVVVVLVLWVATEHQQLAVRVE
jgi:hypothetical protein